ncbi:MAG: ATP-binding protein [Pseudomonadota bacterium]
MSWLTTPFRSLARLDIATRLILLFGGVVLGLAAVAASVALETSRQLTALENLNDRLEIRRAQNMEMLGRLTSGVAHDFNNLLTVLSSNLEMLRRPGMPEALGREMLARCERATQRGRKLTRQLLSLGQRPEMRPERVDLCAFLQDFEELVRRTLPASIMVETVFKTDLPAAHVDPGLLQDALLNLVVNARDAMPEGGHLQISAVHHSKSLELCVRDTGTGIEPALLERIFEPFFTTKGAGKGPGLGLGMVHDFAARSGGTVDIASAPGEGTTVTLALPMKRAAVLRDLPDSAADEDEAATVALVEEDADLRDTLRALLEFLGHRVQVHKSTADALAAYRWADLAVDVLVCRPRRHRTVGVEELTQVLRARDRPVALVILADVAMEKLAAPLAAELDGMVARMPVVTDTLRETLRIALRSRSGGSSDHEDARPR